MHPTPSWRGGTNVPKRPAKARPLRVFTRSRLGAIKVPNSLRAVLLDFTMSFLIECPKDVIKFGFAYFKNIKNRKKVLKKHGEIFEDPYSDDAEEGHRKTKKKCYKCSKPIKPCKECKRIHMVCYECTKKLGKSPPCAMVDPSIKKHHLKEDENVPPIVKDRRDCIFAEGMDSDGITWEAPIYEKKDEQINALIEFLRNKTLFKDLEDDELKTVVNAMFIKDVETDEVVIRQGRGGDFFYVVESGKYRAYLKDDDGNVKILNTYQDSGSFGELALMYNVPRYCSIKALTDGKLWVLDRETFRKIVISAAMKKREFHLQLLRTVPILKALNDFEMLNVADSLDIHHYKKDEKIIEQGEEASGMFFIDQGEVTVSCTDEYGVDVVLDTLEGGAYFGEVALIEYGRRTATVTAATNVRVAFLHRDAFERLLGPCRDKMTEKFEDYEIQRSQMIIRSEMEPELSVIKPLASEDDDEDKI